MPNAPRQYLAAAHRAVAYGGAIEWEELPSLATSLAARRDAAGTTSDVDGPVTAARPWDDTLPSALDPLGGPESAPAPFDETLQGLATREVHAPDVFQHFFGATAKR